MHGAVGSPIPTGSGSTLLQTVNVKIDENAGSYSSWNWWRRGLSDSLNLLNSSGATTGFNMLYLGGAYTAYEVGSEALDVDFPAPVLRYMMGLENSSILTRITGLNAANTYKITFAGYQDVSDPTSITDVIVNGVTYHLLGPNSAGIVYKVTATVVNPPSGIIDISYINATAGSGFFACINAFILKEYTS